MLKAQNLHKSYGKLEILKGVDLHVKTGEVVSIVGASGAGKSTLLHIVGTLDNADNGSLIIDNIDVSKLNSRKISEFRNQKSVLSSSFITFYQNLRHLRMCVFRHL